MNKYNLNIDSKKYILELNRSNVVIGSGGEVTNAVWGTITGDINQQTDLQKELTSIKESIPEPYNDTEIKEDITTLQSAKADKSEIPDISNLASKDEIPDTSTLATKTELEEGLSTKANTSALNGLATKEELNSKANTSDVYSKTEVDQKIDEAIVGGEIDLSNYYTKSETYSKSEVDGMIPDISGLATKTELESKADVSSLDNLATKTELSSALEGKADKADTYTKSEIDGKNYLTSETDPTVPSWAKAETKPTYTATEVGAIPIGGLKTINGQTLEGEGNITIDSPEGGFTDSPLDGKLYGRKDGSWAEVVIPTIDVDKEYVDSALENKLDKSVYDSEKANFVTSTTLEGYATKEELNNKLDSAIYNSDKANFVTNDSISSTLDSYATKTELEGKLDTSVYNTDKPTFALKTQLPDTYTKEEIDNKITSVYKYKGSVANYESLPISDNVVGDVYNLLDTGYNYAYAGEGQGEKGDGWDSLSGIIDLTEYIKIAEADTKYVAKETGKSLMSDSEITRLASVTNYDDTEIKSDISTIQTDLNNKVTDTTLTNNYYNKTDADSRFITDSELNNKGYITTSTANSTFATKSEIPDISNLATKTEVSAKANSSDVYSISNADNTFVKKTQITFSTSEPSGGSNGDIWFVYE